MHQVQENLPIDSFFLTVDEELSEAIEYQSLVSCGSNENKTLEYRWTIFRPLSRRKASDPPKIMLLKTYSWLFGSAQWQLYQCVADWDRSDSNASCVSACMSRMREHQQASRSSATLFDISTPSQPLVDHVNSSKGTSRMIRTLLLAYPIRGIQAKIDGFAIDNRSNLARSTWG